MCACRFRRIVLALAAIAVSWSVLTSPANAGPQPVSSTDLIERAGDYDGQEIIYTGEAIGEIMIRDTYAWVNVSDGSSAIGLWLPADQARQINVLGSYKNSGDKVVVTGVFHRACPEHGGDLDIHVASIVVKAVGTPTAHPVIGARLVLAALLISLAVSLYLVDRRRGRAADTSGRDPA